MLIVIESPNKSKKIGALAKAPVVATVGHFRDLPDKDLGIDLQTYVPTFVYTARGKKVAGQLKSAAKGEDVYIATDPDREGYAIGMMAYEEVKKIAKACFRLEIREITPKGVKEAFAKAIPFEKTNYGLYDAFLGRRVGDRIVGYTLSPRAMRTLRGSFSVGRVQSPAVRLLVEREREIRAFVPETYWKLAVQLRKEETSFLAWHTGDRFKEKPVADAIFGRITAATTAQVTDVKTREERRRPKAPFTTVDMQATANAQLRMAPEYSMKLAQDLFEHGLITYHRTDSVRLADDFITEIRTYVEGNFGKQYLPAAPNVYKSKNSQAEAHEGIRPTALQPVAEIAALMAGEGLTDEHRTLYELIFSRAVASQMTESIYDGTTVLFDVAGEPFKATGSVLRFDGYLKLYHELEAEKENDPDQDKAAEEDAENQQLPALAAGETVAKEKDLLEEKQTKPPARFTEGRLVKELEKRGIGRPSTYAAIMRTLKTRDYVNKQKGRLVATWKAEKLIDYLAARYQWIIDYELTRSWEETLDRVEEGKDHWQAMVKDVYTKINTVQPESAISGPPRPPGTPSPKQLSYARALSEQTGMPLSEEQLGSSKLISAFIDEARSKSRSVAPLSGKQMAVITKNAPPELVKQIEDGDVLAGRDFLDTFFAELKQNRTARYKRGRGGKGAAESAPPAADGTTMTPAVKKKAPAKKKAAVRKKKS